MQHHLTWHTSHVCQGRVPRFHGHYTFTLLTTTMGAGVMISPILQIRRLRLGEAAVTCTHSGWSAEGACGQVRDPPPQATPGPRQPAHAPSRPRPHTRTWPAEAAVAPEALEAGRIVRARRRRALQHLLLAAHALVACVRAVAPEPGAGYALGCSPPASTASPDHRAAFPPSGTRPLTHPLTRLWHTPLCVHGWLWHSSRSSWQLALP